MKNKPTKRRDRMLIGLRMHWFDADPLSTDHSNLQNHILTHRNATLKHQANKIWAEFSDFLRSKSKWQWQIVMQHSFVDKNNNEFFEKTEFTDSFVLEDVNDIAKDDIIETQLAVALDDKKAIYQGTHFFIECVGHPKSKAAK